MKSLLSFLLFISSIINLKAQQHLIDFGAGITFADAIVIDNQNLSISASSARHELVSTRNLFFLLKYTCRFRQLQFSTGASAFQYDVPSRPVGGAYLSVPFLIGKYWQVKEEFGVLVEAGVDWAALANTTSSFHRDLRGEVTWWTLFGTINLESNWKRFKLGLRGQICLTEHVDTPTNARFRLVGLSTHVGYTLWDAFQNKRKRKSEEILFAGRSLL